ncbi:hypothetical protein BI347_22135 [Chromobacterium sphagni]|uniref:Excisionase-like domain-containing protein n=1 Tax=Chromobacterium sphagni TaxID=1903179 RepID=A0A1S1WTG9_9NEIS|nr:excisionase [Chromobacterium sphagni]OHX10478.1 hypothetical protein BI347_22135 [Chromobacterium sphagni]
MLQSLEEWSACQFGRHAPGLATLRRWARDGLIFPPAQKVGRKWLVEPSAAYLPAGNLVPVRPTAAMLQRNPLIKRIMERHNGPAPHLSKSKPPR